MSDFFASFDMRDGRIAGGEFCEDTAAVAAAAFNVPVIIEKTDSPV